MRELKPFSLKISRDKKTYTVNDKVLPECFIKHYNYRYLTRKNIIHNLNIFFKMKIQKTLRKNYIDLELKDIVVYTTFSNKYKINCYLKNIKI